MDKREINRFWILFISLSLFLLSNLGQASANNPIVVSIANIDNSLYNAKQIVRTSSNRIYYFSGNGGHTGYWDGWIDVETSVNGDSWGHVSSHDEYFWHTGIGVAVDSQNIIHTVAFDWNFHPYYQKFNTADSPKGDHSWDGHELLESNLTSEFPGNVVIAIDSNDKPHVIYQLYESYKGKKYITLYYTNRIGNTWNKIAIWPKENKTNAPIVFDLAIGPDNIPYILMGTMILKGNANRPTSFEKINLVSDLSSFVIHKNGDIRAALSYNGNYANYLHDHTQQWNSGWTLLDSGKTNRNGILVLSDDVPYSVELFNGGLWIRKEFEDPILFSSQPSGHIWEAFTSRWSFYNHYSPGIIDAGTNSQFTSYGTYYFYDYFSTVTKASFIAEPTTGYGPLVVNFTDMSSVSKGETILTWAWDFNNDGVIDSTLQNPSTVYTEPGKYTVSLTVTDSDNNKDTEIINDYIEVKTGTDTDNDGISDDLDNCPTVYNPKQTDLNGNGIGDACENSLDLFNQSLFSTGLRKETASEGNSQNVTALMKDGLLTQGVRVQKSKLYDVISFRSNVDAGKLSNFILNIYVSNTYGGTYQTVRIYPYNSDGLTVQSKTLDSYVGPGWNHLDLTSILHAMNGMGFVKFRIVATQNWFDISEAYLTERVDSWEISVNPVNLNFSLLEAGKTSSLSFTVTNNGSGSLNINGIKTPYMPFSIISDGCSGRILKDYNSCSVTVKFAPIAGGAFNDSLLVLSNDADHPSFTINLSGTAVPPSTIITGIATDALTGIPLSDVKVVITDSLGSYSTNTDSLGKYTISNLASENFSAVFSKSGYTTQTINGILSIGETKTINSQIYPYTIKITSPKNASVLNASSLTVTGTVTNSHAAIYVNGYAVTIESNIFTTRIPLSKGQNVITASANYGFGQSASDSITVTLEGLKDDQEIFVNPISLDFGDVYTGASISFDLTVTNIGTSVLTINSITAPPSFLVFPDNCSNKTLSPSTSCQVTVKFVPIIDELITGNITINSNDADNPNFKIPVSGKGKPYYYTYFLPDTGLSECFDGIGKIINCPPPNTPYAQDGSYKVNTPSFTINSNGTIKDNNTGILWYIAPDGIQRGLVDAYNYCNGLFINALFDWRLPEREDLLTIVDYSRHSPSIDSSVFPGISPTYYWTWGSFDRHYSDPEIWYASQTYAVNFDYGQLDFLQTSNTTAGVICMSGGTGSQFLLNNDGTLSDIGTGLMWKSGRGGYVFSADWETALNYCENLSFAGYSDWRLPNAKELFLRPEYECSSWLCDNIKYWSSTTSLYRPGNITPYGYAYIGKTCKDIGVDRCNETEAEYSLIYADKSTPNFAVQCVRGGYGYIKSQIKGTVTDSLSGLPVSSATVTITDKQNMIFSVLTDSEGKYIIPNISPGTFNGIITKDFYNSNVFSGTLTAGKSISVNASLNPVLTTMSNVNVSNITVNSASISWTTDQPSDSRVDYGKTTAYGTTVSDAVLTTNHSITLNSLNPNTIYHFKITSKNTSSGDLTFTTLKFKATAIGDYNNVTVIEVSGNYDSKNPDGLLNYLPRQEIAKEFYKNHQDQYDFFIIFTNFDFTLPQTDAKAYYLEVKNDTQGIGKQILDDSSQYGSNSKLQGIIEMGNLLKLASNPSDPKFEETIDTLAHEQMHRWGASVKFKDTNGNTSTALLGKDGEHWSYLLDTDGSLMYGNDWKDNGNGTFTSVSASKYYSPLDLYLMGFYDKTHVPQMLLIDNPGIDPTKLPEAGATISGAAKYVTINDIISAEGERVPNASSSQKTFKTAFIFITSPGTYTGNELNGIENIRNAWAGRFASLTNGKGTMAEVTPSITIAISSPSNGDTISKFFATVKGAFINNTGNETGVTVNGIPTTVYGNQFIVNHVPLIEGQNTITVTATDTAGNTTTSSINVTAVTSVNYIRLTSNIESGIAPLEVVLRIDGSFSIASSNLHIVGPVQPEVISSSADEYKLKFITEGIYTITANSTGPDNITYQDTISITVMNKNQLDRLLKGKWEGMKGALMNQDIIGVLNFFSDESKQHYNDVFTALSSQLPQLTQGMQNIQLITATGNDAKYRIRKDELYGGQLLSITYYIYFGIDQNGIWKIIWY